MFYDLNVPYSPDDPEISHTLSFLAERTSFFHLLHASIEELQKYLHGEYIH